MLHFFRFWTFQNYISANLSIIHWMGTNYFQAEVRAIMWIYSSVFQLEVKTLFAAFKGKLPLHRTLLRHPVSHSFKDSTSSLPHCLPGWMICDDILLQCIAQIFHLNAAPGPSSIFYGTEYSWIKPEQLPLADAKFFLRWLCIHTCGFLHGVSWHCLLEGRTLNWV